MIQQKPDSSRAFLKNVEKKTAPCGFIFPPASSPFLILHILAIKTTSFLQFFVVSHELDRGGCLF